MATISVRTGKEYQCLECATILRDWYNFRNHAMVHLQQKYPGVAARIDEHLAANTVDLGGDKFTCYPCKRVLKVSRRKLRAHFACSHMKGDKTRLVDLL